jgi:hypothetical protein
MLRHRTSLPLVSLLLALFTSACGASVTDETGGSGGAGAGASGGGGGQPGPCDGASCGDSCTTCPEGAPCIPQACDALGECVSEAEVVCTQCPTEVPPEGGACPALSLVCELDDGVVVSCRTRVTCTDAGWSVQSPNCPSDPPPDPNCPPSPPQGDCAVATDPGLCAYDESTLCGCSDCLGGPCGGQAQWVCAPAPEPPCPAIAPRLGDPCADEALICQYGSCAIGQVLAGRRCDGGLWIDEGIPCPL